VTVEIGGQGFGIQLTIVREIVEVLEGRIEVENVTVESRRSPFASHSLRGTRRRRALRETLTRSQLPLRFGFYDLLGT
jgi:signal transduction histidine kinase